MTNKLNKLKDYFGYSTSEKNGILVLFVILLLTILINILLPYFFQPNKTDFSDFKDKISAFEKRQIAIADSINDLRLNQRTYGEDNKISLTPFYFDPNELPAKEWRKLGLKDWQIETIKNYESKGGKFYQVEDLAKMYCISDEEYKILEPYIQIKAKPKATIKQVVIPFPFDPNNIPREGLQKMNMRENLINAIINYRNKGGKFYTKKDFQKIYTLSDEEYLILEPYITFKRDSIQVNTGPIKLYDSLLVEINTADSLDLQQLNGIGPSFSKRIIKYRNLLGGYYNKKQLMEVYGMDKSRYDGIVNQIAINDSIIEKINVNQASIKELIKHPYIEFYLAKSIISYRNENGPYDNLEEMKKVKLIYEELYQKIVPYLTTN